MAADSTFDNWSLADHIGESERARNVADHERMGYTVIDDPLLAEFAKMPPMSDAEQAAFWKRQALGRRAFNATMESERPPGSPPPFVSIKDALTEMRELSKRPIITTPFATLNEALGFGGFISGQAYDLIGGTGRGKTSWQNKLAHHMAHNEHDVVIAFYEAFAGYNVARMSAPLVGVSSNDIIRDVEKYEEDIVTKIPERIHLLNRPSLDGIAYATRWLADKNGKPPILIVDYAQKLAEAIQARQKRPDPRLAMSEASSALIELADITKATVIAIQSMSRMNNRRARDVRKLAPYELVDVAKESGAVEYDAAGVIVLTLTDDYEGDERIGTMTVAKSRFGAEMHVDMRFDGKSGGWRDLGKVEPDAGDEACDIVRNALLEGGPAATPTELVKRCKGVARKKLFAAIKEMMTETGEIVRNDNGSLEWAS